MQFVNLPWAAWFHDTTHSLVFPSDWIIDMLAPPQPAPMLPDQINAALQTPVDSSSLAELASNCRSTCIVVDDLARPVKANDVLPEMLRTLHIAGLSQHEIRFVIATGSHGALSRDHINLKLGKDVASRYHVECHDCQGDLANTGIKYGEHELRINRTFFEAELKVAVGSVLPHSFAGHSGGAKLVLPGLADLNSTARSHRFVQLGLRGGRDPNENRFRLEAEQLALQLGLKFIVCVITNHQRSTTGVVAGHPVTAHRHACRIAEHTIRTPVGTQFDCLVLNAYPKDIDLVQSENAFVALKSLSRPLVKDDGLLILTSAATEGVGSHGLFAPGGVSYRLPQRKRVLGNCELWLYVPSLPQAEVHKLFWEGYPVFGEPEALCRALLKRFPHPGRAGVIPCAPMQTIVNN